MTSKIKWPIIILVVMLWITYSIEERGNSLTLIQILIERGLAAWIELAVITTAVVIPSYLSTRLIERLAEKMNPGLNKWKSLFYSIVFTFIYYLILMAVLEPIKHA